MTNDDAHKPLGDDLLQAAESYLGGRSFAQAFADFDRDGYIVFESILNDDQLARVRQALDPYFGLGRAGRNDFEGLKSNREYALLSKGDIFAELAIHPLALSFAEYDLGKSCILSAFLAIQLHPGETVQPWHCDDDHCRLARPRPPFQLSAFWSIDETTEENGATEIIPGSHLWDEELGNSLMNSGAFEQREIGDINVDPAPHPDAIKITMPAGSLMLAKGTLYHRGGANKSDGKRLILTPQYSPGWVRPLENMILSTPPEVAVKLPQRARELIGYSIHPPFMGYVDGEHPQKALDRQVAGE